jgi:MinD-like ATPase involved in chromosome partitioning or flagellar assembly
VEASGEIAATEQCLDAEDLLDAVRGERVDAVLVGVGLHRLRPDTIETIGRMRTPLVLLAPAAPEWRTRYGVSLGVAAAPEQVLAALKHALGLAGGLATPEEHAKRGPAKERPLEPQAAGTDAAATLGTVYAFVGPPNSPGSTTCAEIFATLKGTQEPTLLIEADLAGARLDARLNANPELNLYVLATHSPPRTPSEWDRELERNTQPLAPRYSMHGALLCGVPKPEMRGQVLPDFFRQLVDRCRERYSTVVIDVGDDLLGADTELHRRALQLADHLVLVVSPDFEGLREGRKTKRTLVEQLGISQDRLHVIVNKYDARRHRNRYDIQEAMGQTIAAFVPRDYEAVERAKAARRPIALESKSGLVQALLAVTQRAHGGRIELPPARNEDSPRCGWLLRGRRKRLTSHTGTSTPPLAARPVESARRAEQAGGGETVPHAAEAAAAAPMQAHRRPAPREENVGTAIPRPVAPAVTRPVPRLLARIPDTAVPGGGRLVYVADRDAPLAGQPARGQVETVEPEEEAMPAGDNRAGNKPSPPARRVTPSVRRRAAASGADVTLSDGGRLGPDGSADGNADVPPADTTAGPAATEPVGPAGAPEVRGGTEGDVPYSGAPAPVQLAAAPPVAHPTPVYASSVHGPELAVRADAPALPGAAVPCADHGAGGSPMDLRKRPGEHPASLWERGRNGLRRMSPAAREEDEYDALIRERGARLAGEAGTYIWPVISSKGGAGKTTTSLMLGLVGGEAEGVTYKLCEVNPDYGNIGELIPSANGARTIEDLLERLDEVVHGGYPATREYLARYGRLDILLRPKQAEVMERMTPREYARAIDLLCWHTNFLLLDCGTAPTQALNKYSISRAHHVVVMTKPENGTINPSLQALQRVAKLRYPDDRTRALRETTLVINEWTSKARVDVDEVRAALPDVNVQVLPRVPALGTLLNDAHLDTGNMPTAYRRAVKRVLASIMQRQLESLGAGGA